MTAVYACVGILSEAIAGLLLHMYRYKDEGGNNFGCKHVSCMTLQNQKMELFLKIYNDL